MKRKELFYFSNSDLMISVEIDAAENKAQYHTHRVINYSERSVVEKYISDNVLNVGEIFKELEVIEVGVDPVLMVEYKKFAEKGFPGKKPSRNMFEEASANLKSKENEITEAVKDLLTSANDSLWFDRLGDILRDRNENHADNKAWRLTELKEAVLEYNKTVEKDKHIKLEDLIKISK